MPVGRTRAPRAAAPPTPAVLLRSKVGRACAVDETSVVLLHPPLHLAGVSISDGERASAKRQSRQGLDAPPPAARSRRGGGGGGAGDDQVDEHRPGVGAVVRSVDLQRDRSRVSLQLQ